MLVSHLSKQALYSQLMYGQRSCGGQKKCYKETLEMYLKKTDMDITNWEEQATNQLQWCHILHQAVAGFEEKCLALRLKRDRRKNSLSARAIPSYSGAL